MNAEVTCGLVGRGNQRSDSQNLHLCVHAVMEGVHDGWKEQPAQQLAQTVSRVYGYWKRVLWVEDTKAGWKGLYLIKKQRNAMHEPPSICCMVHLLFV